MKSFKIIYTEEDRQETYHVDYPSYNAYEELRKYVTMLVQGLSFDKNEITVTITIEETNV
jgi:predicted solute-binding protein